MDWSYTLIGVAGVICLVIGWLLTSVMMAFISMEPNVDRVLTREQVGAGMVCLIWLCVGFGLGGRWLGYRGPGRELELPPFQSRIWRGGS